MIKDKKIEQFTGPISSLEDRPQMAASEIKLAFDSNSNELKKSLNGVIDELSCSGGSAQIGDDSYGENGNLKETISKVRGEMQGIVLGSIPDGTIGSAQLATELDSAIKSVDTKAQSDLSNVSGESFSQKASEVGITDRIGRLTYNGEDYNAKIDKAHVFLNTSETSRYTYTFQNLPIDENHTIATKTTGIYQYVFNSEIGVFDETQILPINNGATVTNSVDTNPNGYIFIKTSTSNPAAKRYGVFDFDLNMLFEITNPTLLSALDKNNVTYDGEHYYALTGSSTQTLYKINNAGSVVKSITLPTNAYFRYYTANCIIAENSSAPGTIYRINNETLALEQNSYPYSTIGSLAYATDDFFYFSKDKKLQKFAFDNLSTPLASVTSDDTSLPFSHTKNYSAFCLGRNKVTIVNPDDLSITANFTIPETYKYTQGSYYKILSLNPQNMEYTLVYSQSDNNYLFKGALKSVIAYLEKA